MTDSWATSSLSTAPPHGLHGRDVHTLFYPREEGDGNSTIVILAFISGASFVSLILILAVFSFCRWRELEGGTDNSSLTSNTSIVYSIEQDKISICPALDRRMEHILLADDINGLLPPCLVALRAAHTVTSSIAERNILLRNVKDLETLQRAIAHIPSLLDAAMTALVEPDIKPPEVEARMVGLCLGVENLVGLVQLLDGHRQQDQVRDQMALLDRQVGDGDLDGKWNHMADLLTFCYRLE